MGSIGDFDSIKMNETLLQKFIQLISDYVGLQIREQDYDSLYNKIFMRIKSLKLSLPEQYYQILKSTCMNANA